MYSLLSLFQRYTQPGLVFGLAFALSCLLTVSFYGLARWFRLLPAIRERDVHTVRKPRVGGIAMWAAVMLTFTFILLNPTLAPLLTFTSGTAASGVNLPMWGIINGMLVILIVGIMDDVYGLPWPVQLLGQLLAVLMLVWARVGVTYLRLPFDAIIPLNFFWRDLFTVVWVMITMNVMNFFDGLDGLAASVAFTASLVLLFVSLRFNFIATATISLVLMGATAGFLPWNWYPSKLFMGTVGSQLLGFLLGVIAIISGGKVATAVLVLGVPVFDALIVVFRRLKAHVSPFKADQRHLHHRLLKIGLPVPWVVVVVNVVALIFGFTAVQTQQSTQKGLLTVILALAMLLFIIITYYFERRRDNSYLLASSKKE